MYWRNVYHVTFLGIVVKKLAAFAVPIFYLIAGYIPYATAIFLIVLKHGNTSICKPLGILGDKISVWVYIFHAPASAVILSVVHSVLGLDETAGIYLWIHLLLTLSIVVLSSYVFVLLLVKWFKIEQKNSQM